MSFSVAASSAASSAAASSAAAAMRARFPNAAYNCSRMANYFLTTGRKVKKYIISLLPKSWTAVRPSDILDALYEAEEGKFIWGVYMNPEGVNHTGIAIFIGERGFIIDYGAVGEKMDHVKQALGDDSTVDGVVEYKELVDGEALAEGMSMQSFDLREDTGHSSASAVASALLRKDTTRYNVRSSNCRHHVRRCIKRVIAVSRDMKLGFIVDPDEVLSELDQLLFGSE